jgi:hypothetical protein
MLANHDDRFAVIERQVTQNFAHRDNGIIGGIERRNRSSSSPNLPILEIVITKAS